MASYVLGLDLILTLLLAAGLLFHYGNCYRQQIFVTIACLIAWYFSFIIIFVLPLDVSAASYKQCLQSNNLTLESGDNDTYALICEKPYSYAGPNVLTNLWRVVYWTSQWLTWILLPMMQSYTQAGDFHIKGKLKSALMDNAIYYGSYLFICGILLAYIAVKPDLHLFDWQKLKAIASSASNTWGLFLLVFMLGYGLVALPRSLWFSSFKNWSLNQAYFKIAKLAAERNSSEEKLDDCLETLQGHLKNPNPLFVKHLDEILVQVPTEFRDRMKRRNVEPPIDSSEKALINLNKSLKRALKNYHRTETLWDKQITRTIELEDIEKNLKARDFRFKPTFPRDPSWIYLKNSRVEWWWKCIMWNYLIRSFSVIMAVMSAMVIWSEVTFFNKDPPLSLFAIFLNLSKSNYDYFSIEVVSTLSIAYLSVCAFYTIFKIRVLNYYYLAGSHQTDEYSLIFAGMLLCRLTPPLCLNFLGLIHMDSHVIKTRSSETSYTQVMGHMDVLSLISEGFNIYFPMGILIISLLTWFKIGSRVLSFVGIQQFLVDDEMSTDMVNEGNQLLTREKRRRQRNEENKRRQSNYPRRDFARETNTEIENYQNLTSGSGSSMGRVIPGYGSPDTSSPRYDYQQTQNLPPRDLFDDV